jgi:hypothetical protein
MPRAKAPCGTYSAYKRHKSAGEPVDDACQQASVQRHREDTAARQSGEPRAASSRPVIPASRTKTRQESLEWNLALVEAAMTEADSTKLAPLSKRHSELLAELASLGGGEKEVDPLDEFLSGDLSNVTRLPTAKGREAS